MKILALADLHATGRSHDSLDAAVAIAYRGNYDVIVIAGDVSEQSVPDVYNLLLAFPVPVVFCLGNHEFSRHTVQAVHQKYTELQEQHKDDLIRCLDVVPKATLKDAVFMGSVLWYDGTLSTLPKDRRDELMEHIHPHWYDRTIHDFNPRKENEECVKRLLPLNDEQGVKVMVTHMVPHRILNAFEQTEPDGPFNVYSGMNNLFDRVKPDIAICGHTHKQVIETIDGVHCWNVGNDYYWSGDPGIRYCEIDTSQVTEGKKNDQAKQ